MNVDVSQCRTFEKQAAQGDLLLTKFEGTIPASYVLQKAEEDPKHHIVAHSETGHHHVVSQDNVDWYRDPDEQFVSYIHVKSDTPLIHLRDVHTHAPIMLKGGNIFQLRRQAESDMVGNLFPAAD